MVPSTSNPFYHAVGARFHIYNSLFLNLPYKGISRTGTLLPLLQQHCYSGFESKQTPLQIIENFFEEFGENLTASEREALLFQFIQYVERQVVLFDSVEDAAFEEVHDLSGSGTVHALLLRARAQNCVEKLKQKLQHFKVRVVLTAHPTQFYPGSVLAILTDLEKSIRSNNLEHINLLLQQLGKTRFFNKVKPTPFDEAQSLSWYLENVFYHAIPEILMKLAGGLGVELAEWENTDLISIGFWPGGDRDGNPFVTNETTIQVAAHLRERILTNYHKEIRILKRRLTFKGVDEIVASIEKKIVEDLRGKNRLAGAEELIAMLQQAREVIVHEHDGLFLNLIDQVILKIRIFGLHFASIDVRQHSSRHDAIWASALSNINWAEATENEKIEAILAFQGALPFEKESLREDLECFKTLSKIRQLNGDASCSRYIISNCSSASQIIQVYKLASLLCPESELDIIPLFESIDDLANADKIMALAYSVPAYRAHVAARMGKQVIMVGFSDGTKDGGYLRANWSIFKAKEALTAVSKEHGIDPVFFDGRGGPPARGGGNTHDFYASLGPTIANHEIQITIQGQTISSNFGKQTSCSFNLEQLLSAGVENDVFEIAPSFSAEEKALMDNLADAGYKAYLTLKHHPDFIPYLQQVTPLPYFADSNIGSRPAKRTSVSEFKLDDLRAIPFVGTWAQMKQNIPGFFGVGTAIGELAMADKMPALQRLFNTSLFFRTLIGNCMMSLTKTYYPATAHLEQDAHFGGIWKKMFEEYSVSRQRVLEISGQKELMQTNASILESIKLRERIVLPLIAIQQYALQQLRLNKNNIAYRKLVVRCMFGIINAARNSA